MPHNAAQRRVTFPRKIQVGLRERAPIVLVCVAISKAKIVFENEIERSPPGLGYVQANNHTLGENRALGTPLAARGAMVLKKKSHPLVC